MALSFEHETPRHTLRGGGSDPMHYKHHARFEENRYCTKELVIQSEPVVLLPVFSVMTHA